MRNRGGASVVPSPEQGAPADPGKGEPDATFRPLLSGTGLVYCAVLVGVLFVAFGIVCVVIDGGVVEIGGPDTADYSDRPLNAYSTLDLEVPNEMQPPIYFYYQLDDFYQNHRRYMRSKSEDQLNGKELFFVNDKGIDKCIPMHESADGRVRYPCGLIADTFFSDTFHVLHQLPGSTTWERISVDERAETIAWSTDLEYRLQNLNPETTVTEFDAEMGTETTVDEAMADLRLGEAMDMWLLEHAPPVVCEPTDDTLAKAAAGETTLLWKPVMTSASTPADWLREGATVKVVNCTGYMTDQVDCEFVGGCSAGYRKVKNPSGWGIQNGHFASWMRNAGLPTFRKLYGRIDKVLPKGSKVKVMVYSQVQVSEFKGRKSVVLTTLTALGGRSPLLGAGYILTGVVSVFFAVLLSLHNRGVEASLADNSSRNLSGGWTGVN